MITAPRRNQIRQRVHKRIRTKMTGTAERLIDDAAGTTLASASTVSKKSEEKSIGGNIEAARRVGKLIAERAQAAGVKKVVFDRGGYLYHGRVKALAEAAREAGLEF